MGEVAASLADFSVITSDNPRYEDPVAIIAEIEKGYREVSNRYVAVEEREKAIEYLLGSKAIIPYRWAFIISVGLGASMKLDLVWTLSDIFNALMAFPNLIGLIMLTPVVKAETLAYLRSLKKEPASEG